MRSWFIVHRRELIKQSVMTFDKLNLRHGVIANTFMQDPHPLIQICSIGTLQRRYHKLKPPRLLVWDECHHLGAATWQKIFHAFPNSFHIGLSATPVRTDGQGLGKYFETMVEGPSVNWLIENKYLSDYKLYAPSSPDLTGVKTRMGDFIKSQLNEAMDRPTITGSAINEYIKLASGKRAVVFAVSIQHSKHIVEQFKHRGIAAEHVDGESDQSYRDAAIKRFQSGETKILSNVDLFGEGFDLPAIECGILLRPTQSLGLYLQMIGRVLRPSEGKSHAIILDHANNAATHGLPDDEREWSLEGITRKKRKKDDGPSVKICESCFAAQLSGSTVCRFCGYSFPSKPREVDQVDGELIEVDAKSLREKRKIEQRTAKTFEELVVLGKKRKYKNAHYWAKQVMASRNKKRGSR
jgi:superfamily II DNA or RNA helicase